MWTSGKINGIWPRKTCFLAESGTNPGSLPTFKSPFSILGMEVAGDPVFPKEINCVQVLNGRKQRFEGPEKVVLADLLEFIKVHDPDVILFPYADTWVPFSIKKAKRLGLEPTFSRSGFFKSMGSRVLLELWQGQPQGRSYDP